MTIKNVRCCRVLVPLFIASGALLSGCGGGGGGGGSGSSGGSVDLSGIINIEAGSRVDGDTAEIWWANGDAWPQGSRNPVELPVPASVGGYLSSEEGTYPEDDGFLNLTYPQDLEDTYRIPLENDDRLSLQVFSSEGSDSDDVEVTLEAGGEILCAGSDCLTDGLRTMAVRTQDNHLTDVVLRIESGGPVRYLLSVAPEGSGQVLDGRWPEPGLVPGEAIVSMPEGAAAGLSVTAMAQGADMEMLRSIGPNAYQVRQPVRASALASGSNTAANARADTVEWIKQLREQTGLNVEPNYLVYQQSTTPDSNTPYQNANNRWNLDQIRMQAAWDLLGDESDQAGAGVGVAVLDTGLYREPPGSGGEWHPELVGAQSERLILSGIQDFVSSTYDVDGTPGPDDNPATPATPAPYTANTSFHGTHVAGIITGRDNTIGTLGVAHSANLIPFRVLGVGPESNGDGVGTASDLIAAINSAAQRSDIDVINLSLGGLPPLTELQAAIDAALDNGILVVAAGGNSANASMVYPAASRGVVGVGATNENEALSSFSNFGPSVSLIAPGGEPDRQNPENGIYNAYGVCPDGQTCSSPQPWPFEEGYAYLAGSSMAAPHVSGVYALMKQSNPEMSQKQFRALLLAGELTDTVSPTDNIQYDFAMTGNGLLNAEKAVSVANDGDFPTVVSASPRALYLRTNDLVPDIELELLAPGDVSSVNLSEVALPGWLQLVEGPGGVLSADEPGLLRVAIDEDSLPEGRSVNGNIEIPYGSEGRVLTIPVQAIAPDEVGRYAGFHFVLLIDPNDQRRSRQVVAEYEPANSRYRFRFDNVEPGTYLLVAGSDLDNNGFLCENGEACAQYPELGNLQPITINGSTGPVTMTTSFQRPQTSEMELPSYGFKGYRIPQPETETQSGNRQLSQ